LTNNSSGASLLADTETIGGIDFNDSIGHSSIPKESIMSINESPFTDNISQISIDQISPIHNGFAQVGTTQISTTQVSTSQVSPSQIAIMHNAKLKNSSSQIGFIQNGVSQGGIPQISSKAIGSTQVGTSQVDAEEIGSSQVDSSQVDTAESNPFHTTAKIQINSSKITLPSSVTSQQFISSNFPSHNSTPEIINVLNNSATKIWSDLLQSPTQLDIDFQITDLPSGQLAEATITGFDDSGKPNAGKILIDHDANGVGWFIDETPLDNSEFTSNTANYFLAEPDSEASGKYDLLTTVLHELSHLYGFIDGYQGYSVALPPKMALPIPLLGIHAEIATSKTLKQY
jgi:hypothetical protein